MKELKMLKLALTESYLEKNDGCDRYEYAPELKKALEANDFQIQHDDVEIYPWIPELGIHDTDSVKDEYSIDIIFVPKERMAKFKEIINSLYENWDIEMNPDNKEEIAGEYNHDLRYNGFLNTGKLKSSTLVKESLNKKGENKMTTVKTAAASVTTVKTYSYKFATVGVEILPTAEGFLWHVYIAKRGPKYPFLFGSRKIEKDEPAYAEMVAIMEATKWAISKGYKKLYFDGLDRQLIVSNLQTDYGQKFSAFMKKASGYCKVTVQKTAYNNNR